MKREGGVDTEWGFEGVIGHDRRDVFLRRTGPGPGASPRAASAMRERSAMSQGLRRSGGASREDIQGRLSNAGRRLRPRRGL